MMKEVWTKQCPGFLFINNIILLNVRQSSLQDSRLILPQKGPEVRAPKLAEETGEKSEALWNTAEAQ
ncbi:hypothetical protein [Brevibacillus sp. SIMBA_040]|uniref:hypothetical protein n=1 Tax=unclassified Brevibacillus TaxID=2684853 RepID=UPI00397A60D1